MHEPYEIFYRRMSEPELELTKNIKGLTEGRAGIVKRGINHKSDPHKWITSKPKYALSYKPKNSSDGDYPMMAVYYAIPGTNDALTQLKSKSILPNGSRRAFGITPEYIDWFNNRVVKVELYDLRKEGVALPQTESSIQYLMKGDKYVLFQAFSPQYINEDRFTDLINLNRMSWLKTSLLWMLWRTNWGKKHGHERVIEVEVPPKFLLNLEQLCVSSKHSSPNDEVIYQIDPDRAIIGRFFQKDQDYWVHANSTKHFGIRANTLSEYVLEVAPGNLRDITEVVQKVEHEKPLHPTTTLYNTLDYRKVSSHYMQIKEGL